MSQVYEYVESREINTRPPSATMKFICDGYDSVTAARTAVASAAPAYLMVANYQTRRGNIHIEQNGRSENNWIATVSYGIQFVPIQFDTSGTTTKITHSYSTRGKYPASGEKATDYGCGINYNESSGQFEGVDITIPCFSWSETYTFQPSQLTYTYVTTLASLTGCINAGGFRGFQSGEVLFQGASGGSQKSDTDCEVTFRFAANPNRSNITVAGIKGVNKGGWDYLWVASKDSIDPTTKKRSKKPVQVNVESVYPTANFSLLGI